MVRELVEADALEAKGHARRAFRLFLRGANAGSAECAERVGLMLGSGVGVRRSPAEELRWHRIAVRRGASPYNLAVAHAAAGRWSVARRWWERAIAWGDRGAAIDVALCLLTGRGARRDPARAHRLLTGVVRLRPPHGISMHEHELATALLGVLAARGLGTARNLARARRLLAKANRDGDYPEVARAMRELEAVGPLDVVRTPPWRGDRGAS